MTGESLNEGTLVDPRALESLEAVAAFIKILPLQNAQTIIRFGRIVGFPEIVDIRSNYPGGLGVAISFFLTLVA